MSYTEHCQSIIKTCPRPTTSAEPRWNVWEGIQFFHLAPPPPPVCGGFFFLQTSGHLSSLSATRYVNRCRRSDDRVGRVGRTATDAMSQAMADPRITEYRQRPLALCLLFEIELGSANVTLHFWSDMTFILLLNPTTI